jgi:two-component system OmpR family response regulator
MRILVVEDDSLLAQGLTRILSRAGHAVDQAENGLQADKALRAAPYELVVLDIGLPDIDGFEVLRRLRRRHAATNVLVLTARDAVEDRVHGLDLGADDYLTKPFSVNEFEARVRALLRRTSLPAGAVSMGGLTVDVEAKRVRVNGTSIELTVREWALLELFMARPGRVLSKEQIAQTTDG